MFFFKYRFTGTRHTKAAIFIITVYVIRFGRELQSVESEQGRVERAIAVERTAIERLQQNISGTPSDLRSKQNSQGSYYERLETAAKEIISGLEKERDGRAERVEAAGTALAKRFDELRRQAALAAENEDADGGTGLSKRLKALGVARGYILAIEDAKADNRRLRKAKEFIGTPAFQTWLSQYQRG